MNERMVEYGGDENPGKGKAGGFSREIRIALLLLIDVGVHTAISPRLRQLLLKHLADGRVLITVFNLIAALFNVLVNFCDIAETLSHAEFDSAETRGQIAGRRRASVEMLVEPHLRRHEDAAILPVVTLNGLSFLPKKGEAFSFDDDDVEAGTVPVGLLISPDRKFGDVSCHRSVGHLQHDVAPAGAAFLPLLKFEVAGIGNKIGFPDAAGMGFSLAAEVVRIAVEAVREIVRHIKNDIRDMKEIKDARHVVDREKPRRLVSLSVKVLVPDIERQRDQTPLLPLEGLFGPFVVPYRRRPAPLEDIDQLLVNLSLGIQALAGSYLANIGAGRLSRPFHINKSAIASSSIPMADGNLSKVLDEKTLNYRDSLFLLPFLIIGNIVHHVFELGRGFSHIILHTKFLSVHTV